ncbi:MAG: hypothetical protein HY861_04605 [Chlamydiia bacterium]|nr:hypothetical protein [Chlamydiia bacterium]
MSVTFVGLKKELDAVERGGIFDSQATKTARNDAVAKIADQVIQLSLSKGCANADADELECYKALHKRYESEEVIDLDMSQELDGFEKACIRTAKAMQQCAAKHSPEIYMKQGSSSQAAECWRERDWLCQRMTELFDALKRMQSKLLKAQYQAPRDSLESIEAFSKRRQTMIASFNKIADLQEALTQTTSSLDSQKLFEQALTPRLEADRAALNQRHAAKLGALQKRLAVVQRASLCAAVALGVSGVLNGMEGSSIKAGAFVCIGVMTVASRWLIK